MSLLLPSQWQWQPAIQEPGYKGWCDAGMTITFNIIQEGKPVITKTSQPPLTVAEALGALQCLDSSWTGTAAVGRCSLRANQMNFCHLAKTWLMVPPTTWFCRSSQVGNSTVANILMDSLPAMQVSSGSGCSQLPVVW